MGATGLLPRAVKSVRRDAETWVSSGAFARRDTASNRARLMLARLIHARNLVSVRRHSTPARGSSKNRERIVPTILLNVGKRGSAEKARATSVDSRFRRAADDRARRIALLAIARKGKRAMPRSPDPRCRREGWGRRGVGGRGNYNTREALYARGPSRDRQWRSRSL
jgi:hypothetical protein